MDVQQGKVSSSDLSLNVTSSKMTTPEISGPVTVCFMTILTLLITLLSSSYLSLCPSLCSLYGVCLLPLENKFHENRDHKDTH